METRPEETGELLSKRDMLAGIFAGATRVLAAQEVGLIDQTEQEETNDE